MSIYNQNTSNTYGTSEYNTYDYGAYPAQSQPDYSINLTVSALSYTNAQVSWTMPLATDATNFQLVRNRYNIPYDENDGLVLLTNIPLTQQTSYIDTSTHGGFYYYTMWIWDSTDEVWERGANCTFLSPFPYNYGNIILNRLPAIYSLRDFIINTNNADPTSASANPILSQFTALLGFQLDSWRTSMEGLMQVNQPLICDADFLPYLCQQFGMPYEIEMGCAQIRNLVYNAVHLYKLKGSIQGISEFVSTFTGWPVSDVYMGPNRLTNLNDGVMTGAVEWTTSSGSLSITTVTAAGLPDPTPVVFGETTAGYGGVMKITSIGDAMTLKSDPIPWNDIVSDDGIGEDTFSAFFYCSAACTVTLSLINEAGTSLLTGAAVPVAADTWTYATISGEINMTTDTSAIKTVTAQVVTSAISSTTPLYMAFDGVYNTETAPSFDRVRDIKINIDPQRGNLMGNSLDAAYVGSGGYLADSNSALDTIAGFVQWADNPVDDGSLTYYIGNDTTPYVGQNVFTVNAQQADATLWGGALINAGETIPVAGPDPSNFSGIPTEFSTIYTFSVYAMGGSTVTLDMTFIDPYGNVMLTTGDPQTYTLTNSWQRISVTGISGPEIPGALYFGTGYVWVSMTFSSVGTYYLNGAQLEAGISPSPFFSVYQNQGDPDYLRAVNGASLYYENRLVKLQRLEAALPSWLPNGATYTINFQYGAGSTYTYNPPTPHTYGFNFPVNFPVNFD